jgi:hypothetical protein
MGIEETISVLAKTPRRQRAQVLHEMAVSAIAERPDREAAEVTAALRAMGYGAAADAHENTRWEASFVRRRLTASVRSQGAAAPQPAVA